jgi:aminopeptidase N
MKTRRLVLLLAASILALLPSTHAPGAEAVQVDTQSYSNPEDVVVRHLDLDLEVRFDSKSLAGTATLTIERKRSEAASLMLDTKTLDISKVETAGDSGDFAGAVWLLGPDDPILGAPLKVSLPPGAKRVRVTYATRPQASALQWLEPSLTAGKKHPYLMTQGQAIHTRSWIPLQDTPQVRHTYAARIRTPRDLVAVMSAENDPSAVRDGDYSFTMKQPIPAYLIALAVGDIAFAPLSKRAGVYAEPSVVQAAAREFVDTEKMIAATEKLYGPYRWDRYDILVLPPSFPYGGMENPRLTFATPTILAGDRSLVSLIAHELAHSWSGNLVTNATWDDFWMNEGFTTYLQRRIVEQLYGREQAEIEWALGKREVEGEMAKFPVWQQALAGPTGTKDPDEVFSDVPYEKGALFLRAIEEAAGREKFDVWLRGYFDRHAFRSLTTDDFLADLNANLLSRDPAIAKRVPMDAWLYGPGLPAGAPNPSAPALVQIPAMAADWAAGKLPSSKVPVSSWSTQERLLFLKAIPPPIPAAKMAELDSAFGLSRSGNSEITFQYLMMAIANDYAPAYAKLEEFLATMGRRRFVKPLFEELAKTPAGLARARAIYAKTRSSYHPITAAAADIALKGTS